MKFNRLNRTLHKWFSICITMPFLIILVTGILLLKKEISYIQPPSAKSSSKLPSISFDLILKQSRSVKEAGVVDWASIDRLDVRPNKGIIKVRTNTHWEIQLDASTAEILTFAYRRSDIIEQIHDGTYWQDNANLWLTLPVAILLLLISITGIILFILPYIKRCKRQNMSALKSD